jgi:hypothetical protein
MVAITHPANLRLAAAERSTSAAVYRRRRLAVLGLALVFVAVLSMALQQLVPGSDAADPRPVARVSVVVAPGDTVWSIATSLAPDDDPRPVVDAIVAANGGSVLVPGQRLELVVP